MGAKLTNWMREAIVNAVVAHRFHDQAVALVAERAAHALRVYDEVYPDATYKRMAALPKGWLPDVELMLRAWHSGPSGREVALHMADLDRNRATRANTGDAA